MGFRKVICIGQSVFNRRKVVSRFAATSADSFPGMTMCRGTQQNLILFFLGINVIEEVESEEPRDGDKWRISALYIKGGV